MIYADAAATTRLAQVFLKPCSPTWRTTFSILVVSTQEPSDVRRAVNGAHSIVGEALGCQGREIFFTSGGTEADNWALKQFIAEKPAHIITSQIEHKAILNTCKALQQMGWEVTYLPVDKYGIVQLDDLQAAMRNNTRLVSIMLANNEVGTIEPIKALAAVAHAGRCSVSH